MFHVFILIPYSPFFYVDFILQFFGLLYTTIHKDIANANADLFSIYIELTYTLNSMIEPSLMGVYIPDARLLFLSFLTRCSTPPLSAKIPSGLGA